MLVGSSNSQKSRQLPEVPAIADLAALHAQPVKSPNESWKSWQMSGVPTVAVFEALRCLGTGSSDDLCWDFRRRSKRLDFALEYKYHSPLF